MILIAYDGSADADAAIDHVAALLPGSEVTVVSVWEPFVDIVAVHGLADAGDDRAADRANEAAALTRATAGAARATAAGLSAVPQATRGDRGVAGAVLAVAAELDAALVAAGTRGQSGLRSLLLGSVAHALLQHTDRPVLIVPSPVVAEERRGWVAGRP